MTSPLAGLAATIHGALKDIFFDAVLTREVVPESPAYDPADPPPPVPVHYPCKAIMDSYSRFDKTDTTILQGDAKLLVLAGSLSITPLKDDKLEINNDGIVFSTISVEIDPATACWVLQGRQ